MSNPWTFYWITRLDHINFVIDIVFCLVFIFLIVASMFALGLTMQSVQTGQKGEPCNADKEACKMLWGVSKVFFCCSLVSGLVLVLIPSTKDVLIILGIPSIVSSEKVTDPNLIDIQAYLLNILNTNKGINK